MVIDPLTLMIPGAFTLAFTGTLLAVAHFRLRDGTTLLWWSVAMLLNALSVTLLFFGIALRQAPLMIAGSFVSTLAPPLYWAGMRSFSRRSVPVAALAGGPVLWVTISAILNFSGIDPENPGLVVIFAIWPAYLGAAIWELWSNRDETLTNRWPLAGFMGLHAMVYLGGVYEVLTGRFAAGDVPAIFSWFGAIHFDTLVFAIGSTTALLMCTRERIMHKAISEANIDPLTGAANRRILFESAERLQQRCCETDAPMSVVMFDLDHFKRVNDTLGHKAGDEVIRGFAEVMRSFLRPNDMFGRYGGEEFVLILPNVSMKAAFAIAERARHAFARSYSHLDGHPINMTVSAGVALAAPDATLDEALMAADNAMYAAKQAGRNRVMCAGSTPPAPDDKIVRIA